MITVVLGGGLGNQLFQFAAARRLAERHHTNVRLDLHGFRKATTRYDDPLGRPFALDRFALPGTVPAGAVYSRVTRHRRRIQSAWLRRFVMPNLFKQELGTRGYDPAFERLPNGAYLWGFFESYRYFSDIAERIRADLTPKEPATLDRIRSVLRGFRRNGRALVALHVRRGDQLRGGQERVSRLLVTPQHRQAAMDRFRDADFLVFSDDMSWCRENVQGPGVFYSPFQTVLDDFFAMAHCDHNIVANSTFSWWAAWLNSNPNRVVVAPRRREGDDADFYPPDWRLV